ncbi:Uncharacterised protein [Vibrio cholerae]|nr:Uncharacterised protein [Vibrio cholerae]CSC37053.1 Uncharacterised protein [Vibrio cholerae]CSI46681.1 Uncharacterised protein [Vibrio cholerae]
MCALRGNSWVVSPVNSTRIVSGQRARNSVSKASPFFPGISRSEITTLGACSTSTTQWLASSTNSISQSGRMRRIIRPNALSIKSSSSTQTTFIASTVIDYSLFAVLDRW